MKRIEVQQNCSEIKHVFETSAEKFVPVVRENRTLVSVLPTKCYTAELSSLTNW